MQPESLTMLQMFRRKSKVSDFARGSKQAAVNRGFGATEKGKNRERLHRFSSPLRQRIQQFKNSSGNSSIMFGETAILRGLLSARMEDPGSSKLDVFTTKLRR